VSQWQYLLLYHLSLAHQAAFAGMGQILFESVERHFRLGGRIACSPPVFLVHARDMPHKKLFLAVWPFNGFISGIGGGLGSFMHMKRAWLFLLLTAVVWVIYWIMSACIVWALQDIPAFSTLTLTDSFFLMIAGSISSVVPVPGGFGAYHGVVAGALLSIWNIPMGVGMIYATLNHESQVITQAVCGLASYIHENFFRRK
jgi:hypothetical protein